MTYDELYPDIEILKQPFNVKSEQYEDAIKGTVSKPCRNCGISTQFVSITFETAICSENCESAKYQEYLKSCEVSGG